MTLLTILYIKSLQNFKHFLLKIVKYIYHHLFINLVKNMLFLYQSILKNVLMLVIFLFWSNILKWSRKYIDFQEMLRMHYIFSRKFNKIFIKQQLQGQIMDFFHKNINQSYKDTNKYKNQIKMNHNTITTKLQENLQMEKWLNKNQYLKQVSKYKN